MNLQRPELQDFVFFLPPLVGALLGARYAKGATVRERATSYVVATVMGISLGAAAAEHWSLGPWVMGAIMFTVSAVGQEALAYVIAALRQGVNDPASTAGKWIDAVLGRRRE